MGRNIAREILEKIRKKEEDDSKTKRGSGLKEDSELQMYATEPPGAMGEDDPPDEEMEFTIDESGPLDENEWMTLDEMELECVECAGKMRDRKMTRILRREAEACAAKYGKKECGPTPDDEG